MKFTADQLQEIENFGGLRYLPEQICTLMDIEDKALFLQVFNDPNSLFSKHYEKGAIKAQYALDLMVFEQAQNGDFKALTEHNRRINVNNKALKRVKNGQTHTS
jgi:hypothetical protein